MPLDEMTRRDALRLFGSAAAGLALAASVDSRPMVEIGSMGFRSMRLHAPDLEAMRHFYGSVLGLPTKMNGGLLKVTAGSTELAFEKATGAPVYHFAFNIPENKIEQARDWVKKRTPVTLAGGREIVHFESWNAHATYFFDPAGNIVEFIARHTLRNSIQGAFDRRHVLYASELGLVVDDVPATVKRIGRELGMKPYHGSSDLFTAVGNEHSLLIVVKRGRLWFGSNELPAAPFEAVAEIAGSGPKGPFDQAPYRVLRKA